MSYHRYNGPLQQNSNMGGYGKFVDYDTGWGNEIISTYNTIQIAEMMSDMEREKEEMQENSERQRWWYIDFEWSNSMLWLKI
jgi:hypothetical protein